MSDSCSALEAILSSGETQSYRLFPADSILSSLSIESLDTILTCYHSLVEYSFDEIKIDVRHKQMLAKLLAQTWVISRTQIDTVYRFCLPLSLLLDKSYEFDFDQEKIFLDLFSSPAAAVKYPKLAIHHFDYDQRLNIFPELSKLGKLPLSTRFTFIFLVIKSDYISGFLSRDKIYNVEPFLEDFDILEQEGLLTTKPTSAEFLRSIDSKDLKRFGEKMGVFLFKKRDDLIGEISQKVSPSEIQKFIQEHEEIKTPLLPKMARLPVLRKFMLDEAERLSIYLEWVAFKLCRVPSVIVPILDNQPLPGDRYLNIQHEESDYLNSRNPKESDVLSIYTDEEIGVIKSFWNTHCEEIVKDAILEDGIKQITSYLYDIDAVGFLKKKLPGSDNMYWKYVLRAFVDSKYTVKFPLSSKMMVCNGCGHEFREYSIGWYTSQHVNGNIQFCQFCYDGIIWHEYRSTNIKMAMQSDSAMLDNLNKLYKSLERIPTLEFMKNVPLRLPSRPTQKQISIGITLLEMPSPELYVERFGSWLRSLELAGVLEGGYRKTSRGIQVIAKDGHICLSLGEKVVDDWLSARGVLHEKEPKYPFHPEFNPRKFLRADWKVKDTLVEYAGMMKDYEYSLKMKKKKSLADEANIDVIILTEEDLDDLENKLGRLPTTK
jgi:hypothetical protein